MPLSNLLNQQMNNQTMQKYQSHSEKVLRDVLSKVEFASQRLKDAVFYSVFSGGKRLRPILVYLTGSIVDANPTALDVIAAAVELTHCYSLIHDDLPAMDNDDYRRGKKTCHREFDEATAILSGNGLQGVAIEILLDYLPEKLSPTTTIQITKTLIEATGFIGMTGGQSLDLIELQQEKIEESRLEYIHQLKTGALFSACINMALSAGKADEHTITALQNYAKYLGIAYQAQNDYQDYYHKELLGKNRGSDETNAKLTFAYIKDKQALLQYIQQNYLAAEQSLESLGNRGIELILFTKNLREPIQ